MAFANAGARLAGSGGYTLIEVLVAVLLTALMASSVMSVALSSKMTGGRSDRKLIANELSRQLTSTLKSYVSADQSQTLIPGPGSVGSWSINGASYGTSGTSITDSQGGAFALAAGSHTLTGFLPPWFSGAPYNATAAYFVCYLALPAGTCTGVTTTTPPWVSVTISWTEP